MIKFKLVILENTKRKNGKNLIFLRLTQKNKVKYISTTVECDANDWLGVKEMLKKTNDKSIKNNYLINEFKSHWENKYNSLPIEKRELITIEQFILEIENEKKQFERQDFFKIVDSKIELLSSSGKMGSANCYKDMMNSVKNFSNGKSFFLDSINAEWLRKYETYLKKRNCKDTSISVRMRAIRTIFNESIENGIVSPEIYPFKSYKISKLKQANNVRAIDIEDVKKISELDTKLYPKLKLSKDLFMFSYYTGGMNYKDMMLLEHSNFYNNYSRISYVRSKTNGHFDFSISDKAKEIVDYYVNRSIGTKYLFPILLKDNLTPIQISNRRHKTISQYNKDLKTIGMLCNIDFDLTSYTARHSFASNLKNKGVATDIISEAMGHQNIKVTQVYLKRLENEVIDNVMNQIADF